MKPNKKLPKYKVAGLLIVPSKDGKFLTTAYNVFASDLSWQEAKDMRKLIRKSVIVRMPPKPKRQRKAKHESK